jgi:hypothetical protein
MSKLDPSVRLVVEEIVDNHIKNPDVEFSIRNVLKTVGIEPSLETTLAYLFGTCLRAAVDTFTFKFDRRPRKKELEPIIDLMKRRSMEIRHAYLSRRLD